MKEQLSVFRHSRGASGTSIGWHSYEQAELISEFHVMSWEYETLLAQAIERQVSPDWTVYRRQLTAADLSSWAVVVFDDVVVFEPGKATVKPRSTKHAKTRENMA